MGKCRHNMYRSSAYFFLLENKRDKNIFILFINSFNIMAAPLYSEYSSRSRNRSINHLLPMNSGYSAVSRMLKQRARKEEISAFYARQSEGLPHIPSYLSNSVYAHLVQEQFDLFNKINESEQDTNIEPTVIELRRRLILQNLDDRRAIPSYERLSVSNTRKRVPSTKEQNALTELVNRSSYNRCLAMQDLRLPTAWDVRARHEFIEASPDNMQLTYTGKKIK